MASESSTAEHTAPAAAVGVSDERHKSTPKSKATASARAKTVKRNSNSPERGVIARKVSAPHKRNGAIAASSKGFAENFADLKDSGIATVNAVKQAIVDHPKSTIVTLFGAGYLWWRLRK